MRFEKLDIYSVGERIKKIRGNLSQTAFAKELNVDRQSIARYEAGERTIDANVIFILMTKFNIDANWLLTGQGESPDLTPDEQELLLMFRSASLTIKAAALGALTAGTAQQGSTSKTKVVNISGNNNKGSVFGNVNTYHIGDNKK